MNTSLLSIIKRITAEQGEGILADPQRLKEYFKMYAHNEPKEQCLAFGRCIEQGYYQEFKKAKSAAERQKLKPWFAQNLQGISKLDIALCNDALDLLEAAVWGIAPQTPAPRPQAQYQQPAPSAPPPPQYTPPPPQYTPSQPQPYYQQPTPQQYPPPQPYPPMPQYQQAAPQQQQKWWEAYSPIPLDKIPAALKSTLSPQEVVVAISENSWVIHFKFAVFCICGLILGIILMANEAAMPGAVVIGFLCGLLFIHRSLTRRRVIIVTNLRILGAFNVGVFSTDKVDLPLRAIDSFGVDDTVWGNLFGYTKLQLLSRSSTYYLPHITKKSCQAIKNAYYSWAAGQP